MQNKKIGFVIIGLGMIIVSIYLRKIDARGLGFDFSSPGVTGDILGSLLGVATIICGIINVLRKQTKR